MLLSDALVVDVAEEEKSARAALCMFTFGGKVENLHNFGVTRGHRTRLITSESASEFRIFCRPLGGTCPTSAPLRPRLLSRASFRLNRRLNRRRRVLLAVVLRSPSSSSAAARRDSLCCSLCSTMIVFFFCRERRRERKNQQKSKKRVQSMHLISL